jgi:hypothetical protein
MSGLLAQATPIQDVGEILQQLTNEIKKRQKLQ